MNRVLGILLVLLVVLFISEAVFAKDFTCKVTIASYSGKDTSGASEASYPIVFKVLDAATNTVLSSASVTTTGVLTNYVMPNFVVTVPSNTSKAFSCYVTVTDAASNVSAKSANSNIVNLVGDDTVPPEGVNSVSITVTP
jgi:hypothetical protein